MSDGWKQPGLRLCVLWLTACISSPLFATDRSQRIDQLHHTAWTEENSGIGEIKQIVQTPDGFLWLKTSTDHLLRFDGNRFEPFETVMAGLLPAERHRWDDIQSIEVSSGGGLWISHGVPRVDLLQDGKVRSFTTQDGLPVLPVEMMAADLDGALWMGTAQGLSRLQSSRCSAIGDDWGYSGGAPVALLVDRGGTLWVKSHDGRLFFLRRDAKAFEINRSGSGAAQSEGYLAQGPHGAIWQSGSGGLRRVLQEADDRSRSQQPLFGSHFDEGGFLFDRDGALWFWKRDGLYRMAHPEEFESSKSKHGDRVEAFTVKQGLSSDAIWSLFQDREGNIWVGTGGGLDRFRNNSIIRVPLPATRQEQFALAAGDQGTVWAANWDSPLFHLEDRLLSGHQFAGENISALYRDPSGVIWVGKAGKPLYHSSAGGYVSAGSPPGQGEDYVKSMAMDRGGGLWVAFGVRGIYRLANGVWTRENERLKIPDDFFVQAIATGDDGRIWFNTGRLTVLEGDTVRDFGRNHGIVKGYATVIEVRGQHTWMGGIYGLGLFTNERFHVISGIGDEAFAATTGILELPNGDLWFNTAAGIVRIRAAEIQRALGDPAYRVQFERFDALDGLDGKATYWIPVPTAARDSNGKLWFSTNKGVFWADPEAIARRSNTLPPPVFVSSITSSGKRFAITDKVQLPVHTEGVQIDYTAPSLTMPERTRFRYLLEGVDQQWQDVGTRRQAFYTNLSPGSYRFRVVACNNDGVWNEIGASMSFVIAPAWYQTPWFRCLCALAILGGLWSLYAVRLAMVTAAINTRLNERLKERERIARDLHDTLLQGFHGLMLRFQAVMKQIPSDHRARVAMAEALDRADDVLLEGRERVRNLRFESLANIELQEALEACVRELSQDQAIAFNISTVGSPHALRPIVQDEAFQIGREALANAFAHSNASTIEVEITYGRTVFQLRVRDDGEGIDPKIVESGRPGHWGLLGMRERANQAGGQLHIWSSHGAGVEVDFTIPGNVAYLPTGDERFWQKLKRLVKRRRPTA